MARVRMAGAGVLLIAALAVGSVALAQGVPEGTTEYELPGESVFPEGIAVADGSFFVSGAGSGGIYQVDIATGEVSEFVAPGTRGQFMTIGMDVDDQGRLWVAGGGSGEVLVYDTTTGEQLATFTTPQGPAMFLNDVIVSPSGDAYITDSNRPTLWRVPADAVAAGGGEAEAWLDFTGTAFAYLEGFNANGLVANEDGSVILVVQGSTGNLYRVDVATQDVSQVDTGVSLPGGDGLVADGNTLYAVLNGEDRVAVLELSDDWTSAELTGYIDDDRLSTAATAALVGDDLLVVNAQFAAMQGTPDLPFTVSVLPVSSVAPAE